MNKILTLLTGFLLASSASACVIYSTSFESADGFAPGLLAKQGTPPYVDIWGRFDVLLSSSRARSGSQSASILGARIAANGAWAYTATPLSEDQLATNGAIIRSTLWTQLRIPEPGGLRSYSAGLQTYDDRGVMIGSILINEDGSVTVWNGNEKITTAPGTAEINSWQKLVIESDFKARTLKFSVGRIDIPVPASFTMEPSIRSFSNANLTMTFTPKTPADNETTRADFDDLVIEQLK